MKKNIVMATLYKLVPLGIAMIGGALYRQLRSMSGGGGATVVTETANRSYAPEELARAKTARTATDAS